MQSQTKRVAQMIVFAFIAGSIVYIELTKPASETTGAQEVAALPTATSTSRAVPDRTKVLATKKQQYERAKEINDPTGFINAEPFTLSSLVGKRVILLDFWTYSCINCRRTVPYLNAWYDKYKDLGLTIVGIHTPEFDFEKDLGNVTQGTKDLGIQYPVVLDSNRGTWNAYDNQYWPHEYLIDVDGYVVHDKIGEGDYDKTEQAIQKALQERSDVLGLALTIPSGISAPKDVVTMDTGKLGSPETYFGSARNEYLANGTRGNAGIQILKTPSAFDLNKLYLDGTWNFQSEFAENATAGAKIFYHYSAKNVYLVGASDTGVNVRIILDGKPYGTVFVKNNKLYDLVKGANYGEHTLELDIEKPGLDVFTFTFG